MEDRTRNGIVTPRALAEACGDAKQRAHFLVDYLAYTHAADLPFPFETHIGFDGELEICDWEEQWAGFYGVPGHHYVPSIPALGSFEPGGDNYGTPEVGCPEALSAITHGKNGMWQVGKAPKPDRLAFHKGSLELNLSNARNRHVARLAQANMVAGECMHAPEQWYDAALRTQAKLVRKQEGYECRRCDWTPPRQQMRIWLHVHHIKPKSTHPGDALNYNNCETVCWDCHLALSDEYGRAALLRNPPPASWRD